MKTDGRVGDPRKKKEKGVVLVTVLVLLFVVNLFSNRHFLRLDLTEEREFTLSNATKEILKGLEDVVVVRLYFSQKLPAQLLDLNRDVRDLLAEFRTYTAGRLRLEFYNPDADPSTEQKVQMMGIPPLTVTVIEKDKQELQKIYLGMAIQFEDKQEIIPLVQSTENLEYRLAAAVLKVTEREKPQLAFLGPSEKNPEDQAPERGGGFSQLKRELQDRFDLKEIDLREINEETKSSLDSKKIPAALVIDPPSLSDKGRFALDQYLMQGGKLLVFSDSVDVVEGLRAIPKEPALKELLAFYGALLRQDLVLDRSSAMATFSGGIVSYHVPYAYWPQVRPENFDPESPIVAELESIVFPWTSSVRVASPLPETRKTIVLAKTTKYGVAQGLNPMGTLDPQSAKEALVTGASENIPLIILLSGKFQSYYTKEGVKPPEGEEIAKESTETYLMVAGSTRFIQDNYLKQFPENFVFFENAIDYFALGGKLIGIRSKGATDRPIAVLSDRVRSVVKGLNLAAPPLLIVALGFVILFLRRTRARALAIAYQNK